MGKQGKRQRVVLTDFKAKAQDRYVDIEGEDGKTYSAMPPELWPDHVFTLMAKEDLIGAAGVVMDDYAGFSTDGGGSAALLFAILKQEAGVDSLGE